DGRGGEVLAVDPEAVVGAPREPEVAGLVAVAEVAGPVPPEAGALGVRVGVLVVALEPARALLVHDLADGLLRVQQPAVGVEAGAGGLLARPGIEDARPLVGRQAQRALGHARRGDDRGPALAHAVAL